MRQDIIAAQQEQQERIKKSFNGTFEKAGEGSRGGKVIGHTKSGKPIYGKGAGDKAYNDFTPQDHKDASSFHGKLSDEAKDPGLKQAHGMISKRHLDAAKMKENEHKERIEHHTRRLVDAKIKGDKKAEEYHRSQIQHHAEQIGKSGKAIYSHKKHLSDIVNHLTKDKRRTGFSTEDIHNAGKHLNIDTSHIKSDTYDDHFIKLTASKKNAGWTRDSVSDKLWNQKAADDVLGKKKNDGNNDDVYAALSQKKISVEEAKKQLKPAKHRDSVKKAEALKTLGINEGDFEKGGEGSKGGKVIGHTKSGKPVYEKKNPDNIEYKHFSKQDHEEAGDYHQLRAAHHEQSQHDANKGDKQYHKNMAEYHHQNSQKHSSAANRAGDGSNDIKKAEALKTLGIDK